MTARVRIAVTAGDPRGIGAEIIHKAFADPAVAALAQFIVVGAADAGFTVHCDAGRWHPDGGASLAGHIAGRSIEIAVAMIQNGEADALVTAPLDKSALLAGGYDFPGHTEMLAALTGCRTAMMLASDKLRVVLATTHIALRDVARAVTVEAIVDAASDARFGLQHWFGMPAPRLALCALNPHAGDHGRFGDEDDRVLAPAARAAGIAGPFAADTIFVRAMRGEFDAVIAPYHDVGMTAIKVASFGNAVNVTLGLTFPRTSPDHGTALDIAGRGVADPSSMKQALRVAVEMFRTSRREVQSPSAATATEPSST